MKLDDGLELEVIVVKTPKGDDEEEVADGEDENLLDEKL
jgi:hypothetical protein